MAKSNGTKGQTIICKTLHDNNLYNSSIDQTATDYLEK
jgi:hypothetical protein